MVDTHHSFPVKSFCHFYKVRNNRTSILFKASELAPGLTGTGYISAAEKNGYPKNRETTRGYYGLTCVKHRYFHGVQQKTECTQNKNPA